MLTYSLSSIWLYSPGLIATVRENWISFWNTKKYFSWLQYLGICQLCCGFWFGILSTKVVLSTSKEEIIIVIVYSFIAAVFSWTFGAFTNTLLWMKALFEKVVMENEQNINK
jgi:hypothetical protein